MNGWNRILVIGATGSVGRQVVEQLVDAGADVRALARNPDSAGLPDGVEVVRGDLTAPATLEPALDGVSSVFLVWALFGQDTAPEVVELFAKHSVRVVYLSSSGVREDRERQADPINQSHADIERLVRESGVRWTFLRAGGFAKNNLDWLESARTEGVVRSPFPDAARPLLHEGDIAAVGVRALTSGGHDGAAYELTGPEVLTTREQVEVLAEVFGHPVRLEPVPSKEVRQQMVGAGWPEDVVDGLINAHAEFEQEPESVTTTVRDITGSPARTFRDWVADHAGATPR